MLFPFQAFIPTAENANLHPVVPTRRFLLESDHRLIIVHERVFGVFFDQFRDEYLVDAREFDHQTVEHVSDVRIHHRGNASIAESFQFKDWSKF